MKIIAPFLAASLGLAACASSPPSSVASAPQPAKSVDAARFYTGLWREIGRRPMKLTDGCVAGTTRYTPRAGGRIDALDDCRMVSPDGKRKTVGGPAEILDPGTNAKLRVHYRLAGFIPVTKDYWVLDRAEDYSWFISADPTFRDLWIYTRDPQPGAARIEQLTARARALGYDVGKLEFPAQPAK